MQFNISTERVSRARADHVGSMVIQKPQPIDESGAPTTGEEPERKRAATGAKKKAGKKKAASKKKSGKKAAKKKTAKRG